MPFCCIVPGCKTGRITYIYNFNIYTLFPFFFVQDMLLLKWQQVIQRFKRKPLLSSHVCELHFREEDIERYCVTELNNKNIFIMPKERPSLKLGAVPCKLLNSDAALENISQCASPIQECASMPVVDQFSIIQNLYETVTLPTKLWFSQVFSDKIIWAQWGDQYNTAFRVTLLQDMNLQIFIEDRRIYVPGLEKIKTITEISAVLRRVSTLLPCGGVGIGTEGKQLNTMGLLFHRTIECSGYVLKSKSGPQTQRCKICTKRRTQVMRKLRNTNKTLKVKCTKGLKKLKNALKRNIRLRTKIKKLQLKIRSLQQTPDGVIKLSHWYALLKSENPTGFNLKVVHKLTIDHIEPRYYQKMNFFGVAESMQLFQEECNELHDSISMQLFCSRIKKLIKAMNCRTPKDAMKLDNEAWKTICIAIIFKEMFLLKLFFGMMRSCCGSNDHPDSTLFIQMYRLVSTYSLVKPPKGSNISGGEILEVLLKIKDIMDITERNTQWDAQIDTILDRAINVEVISEAASIVEDHDYFTCTTSEYVVAYIAGYVARKTSRFACFYIGQKRVLCKNCIATLQLSSSELVPKSYKLISLKSKGNLINPSVNLLILISILEKATLNILNSNELNANTLFEITKILENVRSLPLVGCCKHDMVLTHGVIRFYLTTRIYFICKQENKNNNMQNQRTRERRKAAKLTSCKEIKKTEVKSNEVKAINKRKNEERNVIRNKRKRIDVIQNNKM
ncbi:hypothetical protein ALC57_01523 [Trachymyrmex cornetzi]|uniref:THAP-type domain-containing protein n=1 Tax=Trachymyrmex cornetzi TaxID=471704 RepID=A0A151JPN8_9HYME|nr:hypothetical protein ALC57_01523 [Trachymyrmex cornetzi]